MTSAAQRRSLEEAIVDTVREPLIVLDDALRVVVGSRSFYRAFDVIPQETEGRLLYELGNGQWDIPALRELLETILPRDQSFDGFVVEQEFPVIGRCKMVLNARRVVGNPSQAPLILLAMEQARSPEGALAGHSDDLLPPNG